MKNDDFIMEVQSIYDEYLQRTEKRGISYGEIYYIQNLRKKELDKLYIELLESEA
jgi:hypothetical protein